MSFQSSKWTRYIFIIILTCALVFSLVHNYRKRNDLQNRGILLTGKIRSYEYGARGHMWFQYEFNYQGTTYRGETGVFVTNFNQFVGKTFPVIFFKKTKENDLLITPRDFEIYHLKYPDSLTWVKNFVDKDKYKL